MKENYRWNNYNEEIGTRKSNGSLKVARNTGELERVMLMASKRGRLPGDEDQHFQILQIKTKKRPLGLIDKRSR